MNNNLDVLDQIDDETLVAELDSRGWYCFESDQALLNAIDDNELLGEFDARGLDHLDEQTAKEMLEDRGYVVYESTKDDRFTQFLWDMYWDIIFKTPQQFTDGVNEILKKEIERWK